MSIRLRRACLTAILVAACCAPLQAKPPIDLVPRIEPGDTSKVTVELELGGQLLVRTENAEKGTLGGSKELPMSVVGTLRYDERQLDPPSSDSPDKLSARAVRFYEQADATIKVDDSGPQPQLPEDRRLIVAQRADERSTLYCPVGPLTRQELDLVDVVGDTLLVNKLLPTKPVAEGDTWNQDADLMAALLTLDSVAVCEVQSVLDQFNKDFAKVRLSGVVHGTVDGAGTEMDVRAVYLFDRKQGRVTRLNWAVQEKRAIGGATPGMEGVARLRVTFDPLQSSTHLTDEVVALLPPGDQPPPDDLVYEAPVQGFRFRHDDGWFVTGEERETVTLGRVDRTGLVAQCSITRLPPKAADRPTTLEEFQQDITRSLGASFGQLVSSRQWDTGQGLHAMEVIVHGKVEQIPVEWHYYLLTTDDGQQRATLAVTIEGEQVKRLANADKKLIESLELMQAARPATAPTAAPQPTEVPQPPAPPAKTARRAKSSRK